MPQTLAQKSAAAQKRQLSKSFQIVGEFMQKWNMFEHQLGRHVAALLRLSSLDATILNANLNFQSKFGIIASSIALYSTNAEHKKTLQRALDIYTDWRNVVAHTIFGPQDGGVRFVRIQARRELKIPATVKTYKEFKALFIELNALNKDITKLVTTAIEARAGYEAHKRQKNAPTFGLAELGRQLGQPLRVEGLLHFPTPNQETSPQTPPAPRPKAGDSKEE
jgi:hypothetical protein